MDFLQRFPITLIPRPPAMWSCSESSCMHELRFFSGEVKFFILLLVQKMLIIMTMIDNGWQNDKVIVIFGSFVASSKIVIKR